MRILAGQVAMSLAVLAFALISLRVARALPAHERRFAYAWTITGGSLLIAGTNSLFHDLFAIIAFRGGPESAAWAAVLRWHPILNHSRTFLLSTFCVVLAVGLYRMGRMKQPPSVAAGLGTVAAGMLVGAAVGAHEAAFSGLTHFSAVAVYDIMEMAAVMAVLVVGLNSDAMDRSLWVALGVNGFILALSVLVFAALSRIEIVGQWAPSPLQMQWTKAALHALVVAVAVRHLRRIRRGLPVRALVDASPRAAVLATPHL
ncbi:hypothetical protein [Longimicrobium sp.]|uniref:hypothetical protein n=1 Tax=Longimicrobium sp. TaxID=2029185 RepID=UPI002E2FEA52|nr:hypothetical protein [Longimicrobium sp.]HEX6037051.1 hypothetical protein [Longimicrobium sp.]